MMEDGKPVESEPEGVGMPRRRVSIPRQILRGLVLGLIIYLLALFVEVFL